MFSRGEKPFCKEMNISKRTYLKFREKKSVTEESLKQELEVFTCIPPKPRSTHTKTQGGPGGISSHGPAAGMEAVSAFFTQLVTILECSRMRENIRGDLSPIAEKLSFFFFFFEKLSFAYESQTVSNE